jgi:hypothetical protein
MVRGAPAPGRMSGYGNIPLPEEPVRAPIVTCPVCRQLSPASAVRCLHCGARLPDPPADPNAPLRFDGDGA